MLIRSHSWGKADLSWSVVIEEILHAMEELGHTPCFISTNGVEGMKYWDEARAQADKNFEFQMRKSNTQFDIDLTYTVPQNFPERFLSSSKKKMAIYCYESSHMPNTWKNYYRLVDYVLPASKFVEDMFIRNGCPSSKIKVIPHGVDLNSFNTEIKPLDLSIGKKFKFLCIAEPHYRKQIDRLIEIYCNRFKSTDDVVLILKTKLGNPTKEYEQDLRPALLSMKKKYGNKMPAIKLIQERIPNLASLYRTADAFVSLTASEGFCMPFLEALACGVPVLAPRYGGQLDFLNDENSLLCRCDTRLARPQEQYWGRHPLARVGAPDEGHFGDLMVELVNNYHNIKSQLMPAMMQTAAKFTWKNAAQQIIDLAK